MATVWLLLLLVLCSQSVASSKERNYEARLERVLKELADLREKLKEGVHLLRKSPFPTTFATT